LFSRVRTGKTPLQLTYVAEASWQYNSVDLKRTGKSSLEVKRRETSRELTPMTLFNDGAASMFPFLYASMTMVRAQFTGAQYRL
jgi:hypothetical protein